MNNSTLLQVMARSQAPHFAKIMLPLAFVRCGRIYGAGVVSITFYSDSDSLTYWLNCFLPVDWLRVFPVALELETQQHLTEAFLGSVL